MSNIRAVVTELSETEASAVCSVLVTRLGGSYSRLLGINLAGMESEESFKWFVAAVLLGSPASIGSALSAYRAMESQGILETRDLAVVDHDTLVELLFLAGVKAYGGRIADTLRLAAQSLENEYDADINRLHFFAEDADDLARRIRILGRTVPWRAVDLFLREMRGVWEKARPRIAEHAILSAQRLGVVRSCGRNEAAEELRSLWERSNHGARTYADFEIALVRLGETFCDTWRCAACPMSKLCVSRRMAPVPRQEACGAAVRRTKE